MAAVYSTQFVCNKAAGWGGIYYTVPTGKVGVIRAIDAYTLNNWDQNPTGFQIGIYTGTTNPNLLAAFYPWVRSGKLYHWDGHQVFTEGEGIHIESYDAVIWSMTVSGYLLTLP